MHPTLVNRVVFPLHERLKGKRTHAWLRELERSQWLPPERLCELQFLRLRGLLEFAYREVPYYTRLLDDHEVQPWRITSPEDVTRIPFLTKEIIRKRFDDLQPTRARVGRRVPMSSGGSTGSPVTVMVDMGRMAFTDAARLRAHRWFGVDMGTPEIVLWGSPIESTKQDVVRRARDWLVNSQLLSAFDLSERSLDRYADEVRRVRPGKLYGYASAIYLLASHMRRRGWVASGDWPRAVFTTAEPLYDFQRAAIESVFRCPVSVEYGCRETGFVAAQCPAGGLHIAVEGLLTETVEHGEIVLTHLDSRAMPLIRYQTADVGALAPEPCPCGRGLPCFERVDGRRTDFLVTSTGKVMHALAAIYVVRELAGVKEFQIVQERIDRVVVKVVPEEGFSDATRERIAAGLGGLFDGGVSVDVTVVDSIARAASGKHRYVISNVADAHLAELLRTP